MTGADLLSLFAEWREATENEGRAIASEDWPDVEREQRHKSSLRPRILGVFEAWQKTWPEAGVTQQDYERQFRPIIAELISLETNNAQLLAVRREGVASQLSEVDRTAGNLRGLHRAYGAAAGAHWTSYS